ncbi:MAG: hypothetical protein JJ975_17670 [Bacteroidia bacterium]|nr:hypothetical protein [Bacteroidia bacterium]
MSHNTVYVLILGLIVLSLSGCGFTEVNAKIEKMERLALHECNCDQVQLLSYSEESFSTSAYLEIIGANDSSLENIAEDINKVWRDSISDYSSIDKITLDFINKGEHSAILIEKGKVIIDITEEH